MRLKNKTALVTGAAHGIGLAIAQRFAEEGARVVLSDVDASVGEAAARALVDAGKEALFVHCDVSSAEQVRAAVSRAVEKFGRLDILCNNAAYIAKQWHRSSDAPDEEWEQSFRISLLGAQFCAREALPHMLRQKAGSIINISSIQGLVGGRNSAAYTSMKHGLIGLTRSLAYDYGAENIRCNALCPGAIKTRISPAPGTELYERQISKTFLGRIGEPNEVAHAALFLASDEASYITGAVLAVDGGWTAM